MPHILSDAQYRAVEAMRDYLEDPSPLPLLLPFEEEDEDMRASCGLIEGDPIDWYPEEPEDEAWSK